MAAVTLDPRGRLLMLPPPSSLPSARDSAPAPETDWGYLFRQAGLGSEPLRAGGSLDATQLRGGRRRLGGSARRASRRHDARRGRVLSRPAGELRWIGPWTHPSRDPEGHAAEQAGALVFEGLLLFFLIGGAIIARHNLRAGRGTSGERFESARRSSFSRRRCGSWARTTSPPPMRAGSSSWLHQRRGNGSGVLDQVAIALEPFARRRWPEMLISWSRAVSGRWRDPLVGRDLLIGAVVGTALGLILGPIRVLLPSGSEFLPRPIRSTDAGADHPRARDRLAHFHAGLLGILGSRARVSARPGPPAGAPRLARRPDRHPSLRGQLRGRLRRLPSRFRWRWSRSRSSSRPRSGFGVWRR